MKITPCEIPDVLLLEPELFGDNRGYFMETWNARRFASAGIANAFVQDNQSRSTRGTLRGLHYQLHQTQGKLVRIVAGEVFDVAVDLRRSSRTFGQWTGQLLSAENRRQLWVPPGCAHGFFVTSDSADLFYKCTDYYAPEYERTIRWDDPTLAVGWPLAASERPVLSGKDQHGLDFADAPVFA